MVSAANYKSEDSGWQQLLKEMERPEVQQSLASLLNKLPEIEKSVDAIADIGQFGQAVLHDQTAMNKFDQLLSTYQLDTETISALISLLEKLPKLVIIIEQLENIFDFLTAIVQDEQSQEYLASSVKEYAAPLREKGTEGLALFREIQSRVECNPNHSVKLFSLVKWLRDPIVQKGLCYMEATLHVLDEKTKK